jgi:hypothetical protein
MPRKTAKVKLSEQQAFAERLRATLAAADVKVRTSVVWEKFNSLSNDPPVTKHAVRKWLMGESIPTQQRIKVLSAWLKVDSTWLRFGEELAQDENNKLSVDEQMLVKSYRRLPERERQKLLSLVQTMAVYRHNSKK